LSVGSTVRKLSQNLMTWQQCSDTVFSSNNFVLQDGVSSDNMMAA